MNINNINLNLLLAFDALLTEQHVTRAGNKIHITQSAMSSSLAQLRLLFNDPLLVRQGKLMKPTPRALELMPKIKQILQQIETAITPSAFDPKTSTRTFRLGMSDYVELVLLPKLLPLLNKQAPMVRLKITHLNMLDNQNTFAQQQLDLGIGVIFNEKPQALAGELLFTDGSACVAYKNQPLMKKKLTLKKYLQAKHIVITFPQEPIHNRIDATLNKLGLQRTNIITVPHMIPALFALKNTPYIMTTTKRIAHIMGTLLKLETQALPFRVDLVRVEQAWLPQLTNDPGHLWLRQLMHQAAKSLTDNQGLNIPGGSLK